MGKMQSFSDLVFNTKQITLHNDQYIGYEKRPKLTTFDHGIIYAENKKWIFFHYVVAKQSVFWTTPDWSDIPDKFHINKYGFYLPGQRAVGFIDLLGNFYYRKRMMLSMKKKSGTIKRLIGKCDMKLLFKAVLKQFK